MIAHQKQKTSLLHPNAPQNVTGVLNDDGSLSLSWEAVTKAQAYVIHYGNANESDPHDATMMGYSETTSWTLAAKDVPTLNSGEKLYLYVQTFNVKGRGATDIEKAAYLNEHELGSAWSNPVILTKTP
ncbi:fibronectin type III domain-containing protein [Enterococcus faecium]